MENVELFSHPSSQFANGKWAFFIPYVERNIKKKQGKQGIIGFLFQQRIL